MTARCYAPLAVSPPQQGISGGGRRLCVAHPVPVTSLLAIKEGHGTRSSKHSDMYGPRRNSSDIILYTPEAMLCPSLCPAPSFAYPPAQDRLTTYPPLPRRNVASTPSSFCRSVCSISVRPVSPSLGVTCPAVLPRFLCLWLTLGEGDSRGGTWRWHRRLHGRD